MPRPDGGRSPRLSRRAICCHFTYPSGGCQDSPPCAKPVVERFRGARGGSPAPARASPRPLLLSHFAHAVDVEPAFLPPRLPPLDGAPVRDDPRPGRELLLELRPQPGRRRRGEVEEDDVRPAQVGVEEVRTLHPDAPPH